jgi:hypothetical protein
MQPFGAPVVPLVNAIRQTSSAAVSHAVKWSGLLIASVSSESAASSWKSRVLLQTRAIELVFWIGAACQFGGQAGVAQRRADLRFLDDLLQFLGSQ